MTYVSSTKSGGTTTRHTGNNQTISCPKPTGNLPLSKITVQDLEKRDHETGASVGIVQNSGHSVTNVQL
jgi:hypothetical protein